jgi:peptidoglycan biosynthesis protein MviN/MurJ (putative lipid II flippase)
VFILMPVSAIFFLYPSQITSILLERGAFHRTGVENTALFLKYLGLLLPMMVVNTFVARLFMAGQRIMESFIYQVAFNCVLILFIFLGVRYIGLVGYPLALVLLYLLNVLFSFFLVRVFFPQINYGEMLLDFLKITVLNVLIFLLVMVLKDRFFSVYTMLSLMTGCAVYCLVVLLVNRFLKINTEVNQMLDRITGRL